ncbi:hypothetical protein B0H14DRAFT_2680569 [Mycena olivaceomarginata]|nr:hypothetical protein B0H14DRAFT_2680569 [Mycena olivaceomarginata]
MSRLAVSPASRNSISAAALQNKSVTIRIRGSIIARADQHTRTPRHAEGEQDGEELRESLGTVPAANAQLLLAGAANAGAWQVCTTVPRSVAPRLRCGTRCKVRRKFQRLWAEPYPCQPNKSLQIHERLSSRHKTCAAPEQKSFPLWDPHSGRKTEVRNRNRNSGM